ncbi:MAG: LysM peptidoglycan-binding domain-containing M23 family metallopeptidase [Candidatus Omnitrophota bacterium]
MHKIREYVLRNRKRIAYILYATCYILFFAGCASVPMVVPTQQIPFKPGGVYHRVEKGETLWAISKKYSLGVDDLARANHIFDATRVEIGQLLFIPENKRFLPVRVSANDDFIWPLEGKVISGFGQSFNNMVNKGLNIQPFSSRNVLASRSGKVVFYSHNFLSFGKTLIIDHQDGFLTVYAGASEILVKTGDNVLKGNLIARTDAVNNTAGDKSYLHFEIRKGHLAQNPYFYLP